MYTAPLAVNEMPVWY